MDNIIYPVMLNSFSFNDQNQRGSSGSSAERWYLFYTNLQITIRLIIDYYPLVSLFGQSYEFRDLAII